VISPQYVTPFVKTNKNDRNDAQAIVEAASRPRMNFVAVKSVEQQDIQAVHRVRQLLVHQRTALINQARGLLGERGVTMAKSPEAFKRAVPRILSACEDEVTSICQSMVLDIMKQIQALEEHIQRAETWLRCS
jgi:transposase